MDSVDKYGSCGIPWWEGGMLKPSSCEELIQKFKDAFIPVQQALCDQIAPVLHNLADAIRPAVAFAVDITKLLNDILKSYPDKRVVWLAFCHKKERVRKKNRNRIIRYYAKAVKRNDYSW